MKQHEKHKKKLVYILPEYNLDVAAHTYHLYEFIEEIGKEIDIFLVIEKANNKPRFQNVEELYVIDSKFSASRALKTFYAVFKARIKGYKILYTHYSYYGGILGSIIMRLTGGKSLYWSCGMMGEYKRPFSLNLSGLKDKIKREYPLQITLRVINYLVTGTIRVAKHYAKEFKIPLTKIKIMPNWVNTERLNPAQFDRGKLREQYGFSENDKVILFAHRLTPARLTATVLPKIVSNVNNRIPDIKFLILGDGPIKVDVEKEIREKNLEKNVLFKGWVPNKVIPEFLIVSDVFIIPSLLEGFPRVLIEAMAMGVPFVATDVGGISDILAEEQKEYMVPAGNWSLFADKIVELLENNNRQQKMTNEGLQNINNYSLKQVARIFREEII
jgi:glycosyltransferase involved in cell wall biosynthesis